jgi:hypothetical protein
VTVSGLRRCYDCLGDLFHLRAKDTTDFLLAEAKSARAEARRREADHTPRLLLPPATGQRTDVKEAEPVNVEYYKVWWPARIFWELLPDGEYRLLSDPRELYRIWVDEQGDLLAVISGTGDVLEIVPSRIMEVDPQGEFLPGRGAIDWDSFRNPTVRVIGE